MQPLKDRIDQATPEEKDIIKKMTEKTLQMVKDGDTSGALKYLQSIKKKYESNSISK
jgi:hypothetical protein